MIYNSSFKEVSGDIYAWAVNNYVSGGNTIVSSVEMLESTLSHNDLSTKIFVTEIGNMNGDDAGFDALKEAISELHDESHDYVEVVLIFNSLGSNPDPDFRYHQKFWDDKDFLRSMFADCTRGKFEVPQEGSVGAQYEKGVGGGAAGGGGGSGSGSGAAGATGAAGYGTSSYGAPISQIADDPHIQGNFTGYDRCKPDEAGDPECIGAGEYTKDQLEVSAHAQGGCINCDLNDFVVVEEDYFPFKWRDVVYGEDPLTRPDKWTIGPGFAVHELFSMESSAEYKLKNQDDDGRYLDAGYVQSIFVGTRPGDEIYFRVRGSSKVKAEVEKRWTIDKSKDDLTDDMIKVDPGTCEGSIGLDKTPYEKSERADPENVKEENWEKHDMTYGEVWDFGELDNNDFSRTDLDKLDMLSSTGYISIFSRMECDEPTVSLPEGYSRNDVDVSVTYTADWDGMGLWTVITDKENKDDEQFMLGDTTFTHKEYCTPASTSGPEGVVCWDDAISVAIPNSAHENVLGDGTITIPERGKYKIESES